MLILAHRLDLKRVPAQGNHLGLPGSADVYITPTPPPRKKVSLFFPTALQPYRPKSSCQTAPLNLFCKTAAVLSFCSDQAFNPSNTFLERERSSNTFFKVL